MRPDVAARTCVAFGTALAFSTSSAQTVRGVVTDSAASPLADAIVTLVSEQGTVRSSHRTSGSGVFLLEAHGAGVFSLFTRRLGYAAATSRWVTLADGDTVTIDVTLAKNTVRLSNVEIRAEREVIRQKKLFGLAIASLGGTIITPSEVDDALPGATGVAEMVAHRAIPGIGVDYNRRCVVSFRGWPPDCLPVIVDGLLIGNATSLDDAVAPQVVDYIIVMRGNELGVLYGSIGEKGALLIFTKRGLKRGPQ